MGNDRAVEVVRDWAMNVPMMKYARKVVQSGDM